MAQRRRKRERSGLQGSDEQGWTEWEKAMVPQHDIDEETSPRGDDQFGFMCTRIKSAFRDQARHCGIYEWQVKGTLRKQPDYIVYVGSTCRSKPGALRRRIMEYCTNGSHKEDLINEALFKGYELWVRVKTSIGRDNAQDMENNLLDKYDYAWNIRNNGEMRNIPP